MANANRFVNTGSTTGGTGATNNKTGADRAYVSRASWNTSEATDLVTDTDVHILQCDGDGGTDDATRLTISAWTTGASNYITVTNVNSYRLRALSNYNKMLRIDEDYYRDADLVCEHLSTTGNTSNGDVVIHINSSGGASSDIRFNNLLILGGPREGLWVDGGTVYVNNALIVGCLGRYGAYSISNVSTARLNIRGAVIGNVGTIAAFGANASADITAKNCYADPNGGSGYSANAQTNYVTCGASDTTGSSAALDSIAYSTSTFVNVTGGSEDLHLVSGSGLIDEGTDISGDTNALSTDFDGVTRSGTHEVGAYEFAVGGVTGKSNPLMGVLGGPLYGPLG